MIVLRGIEETGGDGTVVYSDIGEPVVMIGSIYAYSAQYDDDKLADMFEAAKDAALSQNTHRVDIKLVWLTVVVMLAALSLWAIYIMARIRGQSGKITDKPIKRGNMK